MSVRAWLVRHLRVCCVHFRLRTARHPQARLSGATQACALPAVRLFVKVPLAARGGTGRRAFGRSFLGAAERTAAQTGLSAPVGARASLATSSGSSLPG